MCTSKVSKTRKIQLADLIKEDVVTQRHITSPSFIYKLMKVLQGQDHWNEKQGPGSTQVLFLGAARNFNFQCRLLYSIHTTPACNHSHQLLHARPKF